MPITSAQFHPQSLSVPDREEIIVSDVEPEVPEEEVPDEGDDEEPEAS